MECYVLLGEMMDDPLLSKYRQAYASQRVHILTRITHATFLFSSLTKSFALNIYVHKIFLTKFCQFNSSPLIKFSVIIMKVLTNNNLDIAVFLNASLFNINFTSNVTLHLHTFELLIALIPSWFHFKNFTFHLLKISYIFIILFSEHFEF